jgi:hypothetical protein
MPASLEQWFDALEELTAQHSGRPLPVHAVYKACGLPSRADRRRPQDVEDVRHIMQLLGWSFRRSPTRPVFIEKEERQIVAVIGRDYGKPLLTERQKQVLAVLRTLDYRDGIHTLGATGQSVAAELGFDGDNGLRIARKQLDALVKKGYAKKTMAACSVGGRRALYLPL